MLKNWEVIGLRKKIVVEYEEGDNVGTLSKKLYEKAEKDNEFMAELLFLYWTLDYMYEHGMLYNPYAKDP